MLSRDDIWFRGIFDTAVVAVGTDDRHRITFSSALKKSQELTATVYLPSGKPYRDDGGPVSATAQITARRDEENTDEC